MDVPFGEWFLALVFRDLGQSVKLSGTKPPLGKPKMADLGTFRTYGKLEQLEVLDEVWSYSVGLEVST